MYNLHLLRWISILTIALFLTNCGGGASSNSGSQGTNTPETEHNNSTDDEFDNTEYKGLTFYYQNMPASHYTLDQLSNDEFNALNDQQKLQVADKLLSTFFFSYPYRELKEKIETGDFIDGLIRGLSEDKTDLAWLENYILDEEIFRRISYNEQEAVDILTRFYAMEELDNYFFNNWVAYILTQTIMFSPAYELETTHSPNIARVYNRLVNMLNTESGMRYITYVHMMSEDNWRRFRSPEDNGREMLEIFALDMDDSHVPIAGQALQNWKLDRNSDTLVVGLNENREPLNLFGTTIYNGDDFYRELAKSDQFTIGVSSRLVDFFFPDATEGIKTQLVNSIVASDPETWQDILLQIVFSEAYLLENKRAKSAEELFFSMAKKMEYKHRNNTLHAFKYALDEMHQATMKYKLGKLNRVPLDTLSFANYHKFIREYLMLRKSNPQKATDYTAWDRQGWDESFVSNENFNFDTENVTGSLDAFIHYLFNATIARSATADELAIFREHMLTGEEGEERLIDTFNMFRTDNDPQQQEERREARKANIAVLVLDYISRLSETYTQSEVK